MKHNASHSVSNALMLESAPTVNPASETTLATATAVLWKQSTLKLTKAKHAWIINKADVKYAGKYHL